MKKYYEILLVAIAIYEYFQSHYYARKAQAGNNVIDLVLSVAALLTATMLFIAILMYGIVGW